jgi:hypothetical protein
MAIMVQMPVSSASRSDADAFDAAMEALMAGDGGPPDGLMVHVTHPHDEGFMLCQVWRAEPPMRAYFERAIIPRLESSGLAHGELATWPVWSFARP